MTKKRHRKIWEYQERNDPDTVSYTEWTGMMPIKPDGAGAFGSYDDILPVRPRTAEDEIAPDK